MAFTNITPTASKAANALTESTTATGVAGLALNANLEALAARAPKCNLTSTQEPGVTADSAHGYSLGSTWINTIATNGEQYWVCVGATTNAALWLRPLCGNANSTLLRSILVVESSGGSHPGTAAIRLHNSDARDVSSINNTDDGYLIDQDGQIYHPDGSKFLNVTKDVDLQVTAVWCSPSALLLPDYTSLSATAAKGMIAYNYTAGKLVQYNGSAWETVTSSV